MFFGWGPDFSQATWKLPEGDRKPDYVFQGGFGSRLGEGIRNEQGEVCGFAQFWVLFAVGCGFAYSPKKTPSWLDQERIEVTSSCLISIPKA